MAKINEMSLEILRIYLDELNDAKEVLPERFLMQAEFDEFIKQVENRIEEKLSEIEQ